MFPRLYHAHHNRNLEDLPFWLELATQAGGPILELGCGTGRVLIPLAKAGVQAVGVDNDPSMLKYLETQLDPQLQPAPELVEADICDFDLGRRFPLIILPCNTYSTLVKFHRMNCLECVRRHLTDRGTFAVSLPNPDLLLGLPARSKAELEDEFILPETGNPVLVSSSWRRSKTTFTVTWIYDHLLPDGTMERQHAQAIHQLISLHTYREEMESSGLDISTCYGDFDHSDYTEDSANLIILARRGYY